MTSRWGVQLEGEAYDLQNLAWKINNSITSPSSFFFTMVNDVHVLRTQSWDDAASGPDAFQLAAGDIDLLRGCIDVLDTCNAIEGGTVYEFFADGNFQMSRETKLTIRVVKRAEDLATPNEFLSLLSKASSDRKLRRAISNLTPDAPWIDIYRCWESLKEFYGGEHKVHRAFRAEERRIKRLTRTANSFRQITTYAVVPDPMPRDEALSYLKDLLLRTAKLRGKPPGPHAFGPSQQILLRNHVLDEGQPAALSRITLGPADSTEDVEK